MKKWTWKKKIFVSLCSVFVVIQFFRPARNEGTAYGENDYTQAINVPEDIKKIVEVSCFDCHSNKTNYKWYHNIQPFAWWMNHHVEEGKGELNFSEFKTYKDRRKRHKLEETGEMVEEGEMPMDSYLWMHDEAKLNEAQKKQLIEWAQIEMNKFPETKK
jgi:hypothetical protein